MGLFKSTFYPLVLEIVKFLIGSIILLIANHSRFINSLLNTNGNPIKTFIVNAISITIAMIVYLLIAHLQMLRKPLYISFKMCNLKTKDSYTDFHQFTTSEQLRTINIKFDIKRKPSIRTKIARWLIRKKQVEIQFEAIPSKYFILIPHDDDHITLSQFGFRINLTSLINEYLDLEDETEFSRNFKFVIDDSREETLDDPSLDIVPVCKIGTHKLNLFHSLFYDIKPDKHKIRYFSG